MFNENGNVDKEEINGEFSADKSDHTEEINKS